MKILVRTFTFLMCIQMQLFAQQIDAEDSLDFNPRFEVFKLPGDPFVNSVQGMVQDNTGFLWFATQGGLLRYDGQNFVTYRSDINNPNSLSADYVESVFLDSSGLLWLTHWQAGTLTSFDIESGVFTRFQHDPKDPESLSGSIFSTVVEDREGFIWIGGETGLERYNPKTGTFKHLRHDPEDPNSLSHNRVRTLYVDKSGTLWVGTGFPWDTESREGGLNKFNPEDGTFTRYLHDPKDSTSLINNKVRSILEDSRGNFWVGTVGDGLHLMNRDKGSFKRLTHDPSNPAKLSGPWQPGTTPVDSDTWTHISSIFEDDEGRIWITAFPGGLNLFDPVSGTVGHFTTNSSTGELDTDFLWSTYQTNDGTLWITTGGEGRTVFKIKKSDNLFPFSEIPMDENELRLPSSGILKDKEGHIWIARGAFIERIDRNTGARTIITIINAQQPVTRILGLTLDREGYIWAGTDFGQFRGNPQTSVFQVFKPPGIPDDILQTLWAPFLHSISGHFWFGSWEYGLFQYDPSTDEVVNYIHDPNDPNSLSGNNVGSIYEDKKGNIWVGGGSPNGDLLQPLYLDRISPKTGQIERFFTGSKQRGLVMNLTDNNDGNIWFTDWLNGFQKLDPATGTIKSFTSYNSLLPSNNLLSLKKSGDGKLWLSDQHTIIKFDPVSETMSVYNANSGVRNAFDHFNSGFVTDDGELFFSRKGGYHAFYPNQILQERNVRLPDIRITDFQMLGNQNPSAAYELFEKPVWQTAAIELPHDQNLFALSVTLFDFYDPSSIQLQFMLEGYDRAWRNDIRDGETSPYINVPPGDYTFKVRGANSFGVWNMEGATMGITILPPWWKTWWAYSFYLMLFILGIVAFNRFQRKRLMRREREAARGKELEHAKEIELAYKNLGKAHENLKAAQEQVVQQEKLASLGQLTAGIAHEIQNPLNFVNNFSDLNSELIGEISAELQKSSDARDEAVVLEILRDLKANETKIAHHGKRADAIVKGMLEHSRNSSGEKVATDVNALADEYLRLSYHGLRAKDKSFTADFSMDLDPNLPTIKVVPQDIGRVFLNLINNAFQAVHGVENPRVMVTTKHRENSVEIKVTDNGPGIPDSIKDQIFQPFFTTKPAGQGTGLGLSLSYDIIKAHDGKLKLSSTPKGTVFTVVLPVH
ncbi:two-component regulator propeller domain-containing protein [Salinimicrobium sp. CAU 1759]